MTIVYLFIALVPSVLIGWYLYKKDANKEPKSLLFKLFLGGIGSAFLTFVLTALVNNFIPGLVPSLDGSVEYNIVGLFIRVMLGIALIEEFSKWFFSYYIGYKSPEFDEVYDIILYCGFVALGFATFENILYVFTADNTLQVALLRAITAVPGHVCDAILMGYYLGIAKQYEMAGNYNLRKKNLLLSVAIPMLTHGIYDFLIMSGSSLLIIIWFGFLVFMYIYAMKKLKEVSRARQQVYRPVSNMPMASVYFSQSNNYQPMYNTFGANSMYNNQMMVNQPVMAGQPVMPQQPVQSMTQNYVVKYCPNCGKYEPDANFCSQCGTKIK